MKEQVETIRKGDKNFFKIKNKWYKLGFKQKGQVSECFLIPITEGTMLAELL